VATSRFKTFTPKLRTEDLSSPPSTAPPSQQPVWDLDASWSEIAKNQPAPVPPPPGWGESALNIINKGVGAIKSFVQPTPSQQPDADFSPAPPTPKPAPVAESIPAPGSDEDILPVQPDLSITRDALRDEDLEIREMGARVKASQGTPDFQKMAAEYQRRADMYARRVKAYEARVQQMPSGQEPNEDWLQTPQGPVSYPSKGQVQVPPSPQVEPAAPPQPSSGLQRRGEVALGGFKGGLQSLIRQPREAIEGLSAYIQSLGDPVTGAALQGVTPPWAKNIPSSAQIPGQPATPQQLQEIASRTQESPISRTIRKPLEWDVEKLKTAEQYWQPSEGERPTNLEEKVWAGVGAAPPAIAEILLARKVMPNVSLSGRFANLSPQALRDPRIAKRVSDLQEIAKTTGAMETLGVAKPALAGEGPGQAAKGAALGAAAGSAFGVLPHISPLLQTPTIFAVGASQAALEGGDVQDAVASGLTLAILHNLMPGGRRPGKPTPETPGAAGAPEPAAEPVPVRQQALRGASRALPPPPPAQPAGAPPAPLAIARGAIPQWEVAPKMGRRTVELIQNGMAPGQIVTTLRSEGWPEIPGMEQAIQEAVKVMTPMPGYRGVAPGSTITSPFAPTAPEAPPPKPQVPLAPPPVPSGTLRPPIPAPVAAPPVQTDPTQAANAISGLVNLGFSKKDATVLVTQAVIENPTADFETLVRTALGKTNAPKAVQPKPPAPVIPPPLAETPVAEPAPVEAVPVPEITPAVPEPAPASIKEVAPALGATPDEAYDAALKEFRRVSSEFRKVQQAYRAKQIGDQEFLVGKKAFDDAQAAFDTAENTFIEAKNAPEIPPAAAQEAIPGTIAGEPVVEAIPAQPGPAEPPAPVAEPVPTLTGAIGATASARMPNGLPVEFRYRWVNENDLVSSHDSTGRENPAYPQEIQPRGRDRAGLITQVTEISNKLNPDEVADNPLLEHGAPVVGPDRSVESGNGRFNGIKRATPERRQAYLQFFTDNAARFGLNPAEVAAEPRGILVRERISPVEDRVRYAEDLNGQRTARMGPLDQAKVDARRLPDAILAEMKEGGEGKTVDEVLLSQKPWLVEALREIVPRTEWDSVIDQSGNIAPAGVQRVKTAIFQKAYDPQGPLTSLLVETTDANIKNILNGLLNSAPMVARADTRVRMGEVDLSPIGRDLATAAEKFATLRADPNVVLKKAGAPADQPGYTTYTDYYEAQQEMFGGLTPRQIELMRGIEERAGSAKKVREYVSLIAEPILRAPHKDQVLLFMRPSPADVHAGYDYALQERAMAHLGVTTDPFDMAFITRDGFGLSQTKKVLPAEHGVFANEILNGVGRHSDVALSQLMQQTGMIRQAHPHEYSSETLPTSDQVRVMVRNTRSVDPNHDMILDANDPRYPGEFRILATVTIDHPTVESVNAFFERVADIHRSLGLLDRGEGQASAVAYAKANGRIATQITPEGMRTIAKKLHGGPLDVKTIGEMVFNAYDAYLGMPPLLQSGGMILVSYDTHKGNIVVTDNGAGMLPEIASNQLLNIGATFKADDAKAAGGFGMAKSAIFGNSKDIFIRTVAVDKNGKKWESTIRGSWEDWSDLDKGLKFTSREVPRGTETGTRAEITLVDDAPRNTRETQKWMEGFLNYNQSHIPIEFTFNGQKIVPNFDRGTLKKVADLTSDGAEIELFIGPKTMSSSMPHTQILNQGLPQFDITHFLEEDLNVPEVIVANIRPTVKDEDRAYPFKLDRTSLTWNTEKVLNNWIKVNLQDAQIREHIQAYKDAIATAPTIIPGQPALGELPGPGPIKYVDTSQALDPSYMQDLATNNESVRRFAEATARVHDRVFRIVQKWNPEPASIEFTGLAFGKNFFGVNMRSRDVSPRDMVMLNPTAMVSHIQKAVDAGWIPPQDVIHHLGHLVTTTMVHEVTHGWERSDNSKEFSVAYTHNTSYVTPYQEEIVAQWKQDLLGERDEYYGQIIYSDLLREGEKTQALIDARENLFGKITANLAADRETGRGPSGLGGGKGHWVRPLPDLFGSIGLPARRVAPRTPVPRRGALRPEQSDVLESALDRATFDTRLTPPGQIGHAGFVKNGRLVAYHVTDNPETATAQFKAGTRPDEANKGGELGGGLYSSTIPQIWEDRGRDGVYEAIKALPAERRQAFVDAMRSENQHTFYPGYLTASEIERVNRNLELFTKNGGEHFIASISSQPYNMNPERALKAIGEGYHPPVTVDVEMQGKFLDWGALSFEQTKSLQAAAHKWLTDEGYYDSHEKITPKGLAVIRQFGNERDLTNEYLRSLGYDGAVQPGSMMGPLGQTVVWNLDAIRRFGDWQNSRPSPGVAGDGSYYPPKQGEVRLFSPDGVTFTANPELARESLSRRDPNARIRFVDVPAEIGTQTLAPLAPDLAAKARPLWSRTQDLSAIDPLAPLDPWGSKAEDTEPFTPQRDKMRTLWRQFDEGSVPFEEHGKLAQDIRRETAMGITRLNPMILGTTLTDGKAYVLIHEGASAKEPVRLTRFDKDGLSGHEVYQTPTLALVNAIRDGYLDLAPPNTMDRIMSSPGGQRATDFQAVRDFTNELSYKQSPVWATFIKLPFEVQLRSVKDPAMLDAMRAGTVPEEIARYQPPEQLILTPPAMRPPTAPAPKQTELFPAAAVSRRMPTERLRPTRPQAQGDLLANLRPPVDATPDIFESRPPQPKKTDPGVELGFFLGVPRMSRPQREALVKSLRSLLYGEGQTFSGRNERERAMTPGDRMANSRKRFYFARFSTEGFLQALGSPPALEMRNAAINAQADEYAWNADMWRGMDKLQKKYKNNLPEIEAALLDMTKPVPGHIREAVDAIMRIIHPDTGIIPVTTRNMGILGYTGAGGHTGQPREFSPRRVDVMPRVYKDGYLEKVMTPGTKERAEAIAYVLQTGQVRPLNPADGEQMAAEKLDKALAKHIGERQSGGGARDSWAPGLTEAREIDLPDYIHNPFTAVAVRVGQASRKWAVRKQFGKGFSNVFGNQDAGTSGWLDQIQETHGEMARAAAEYLFDIAYGGHYDGGMTGKVLGAIRNYESMTKLPLAILPNMGQNTLAGMEMGIRPWAQAVFERSGLLGPGRRRRALNAAEDAGVLFRQSLRDMETQAGMMSSSPLSRATGTVLRSWSWSESLVNRSIAPRTAVIALQRMDAKLRRGGQLSNADKGALRQIGMSPDAVQQAGGLTPVEIRRGAWRVTDNTQFFERPTAIPGLFDARGPLGELGPFIFQWKSFPVRLQRWMWHGALKEAGRGNWMPLARYALIAPMVGELIALGRSILGNREREGLDEVASRMMENPGFDTGWDVAWHLIKNSTEAYGLGMTAQILDSFGYGSAAPIKAFVGPGASQGYGLIAGLAKGGQLHAAAYGGTPADAEALAKWYREAGRAVLKEVPILGRPLGSRPMAFSEAELLNRMAADEQKALSQAAGYRARSLRSQGSDVDYYLKKELKAIEEVNRKYQNVEGRIPLTGPSRDAIKSNLERIDQEAGERARQHVPKRLRGAYPDKMSEVPQPPPLLFKMAAQVEQDALKAHLASVPPDRRTQMHALLTMMNARRIG
jgi:hypothetical protein